MRKHRQVKYHMKHFVRGPESQRSPNIELATRTSYCNVVCMWLCVIDSRNAVPTEQVRYLAGVNRRHPTSRVDFTRSHKPYIFSFRTCLKQFCQVSTV